LIYDIIYLLVLVLAAWNGYRKGFVLGVFSLVAVIIGLAAAMKLSVVAADWLDDRVNIAKEWLPVISFLLVFFLVLLLVRLGAKAIEGAMRLAMMGWVNRVAGAILYVVLYTIVFSIVTFYLVQAGVISTGTISNSLTYEFVQPWGPRVINAFGDIIPWFRDMFAELTEFFGNTAKKVEGL
jgi:membrane protein required for colicin V production